MNTFTKMRLQYEPIVPELLRGNLSFEEMKQSHLPSKDLEHLFPKIFHQKPWKGIPGQANKRPCKIGVVFSGGPASGGHNVIAGLCDSGATVVGFLGGPSGLVENRFLEIDLSLIHNYRNQGGFDLLGTGRTKIEKEEQMKAVLQTAKAHSLDGLVIIGGDDSNTNAALLAEYFLSQNSPIRMIGVPKTIDGDLRSSDIEISFGFDSATKTYSELIGNICRDAISAKKYYHFIKLMGRSASHIALECALSTQPNLVLIGEERKSLREIVQEITDLICRRFQAGKEYGVILIPEGLIEFIPELKKMIGELEKGVDALTGDNRKVWESLPQDFQSQLLAEKDPHGNIQLSQIETEKLLIDLVRIELQKRKDFRGKFSPQEHFLGYEGRACAPSNFDANYTYALGLLAAAAIRHKLTGMICSIQHLKEHPSRWEMKLVPLLQLMHLETRLGKEKPVIQKAIVDTQSKFFKSFVHSRKEWEINDRYLYPGPTQFWGSAELCDSVPHLLLGC